MVPPGFLMIWIASRLVLPFSRSTASTASSAKWLFSAQATRTGSSGDSEHREHHHVKVPEPRAQPWLAARPVLLIVDVARCSSFPQPKAPCQATLDT
jgi:hypothetical protein